MNTGIFLENLMTSYYREDFFKAIDQVERMGVHNIQMCMGGQVINPDMPKDDKKMVRELFASKNIKVVGFATCRGHKHFYFPNENREDIEITKRDMELAREFGVTKYGGHIGAIIKDKTSELYKNYFKVYKELADFAAGLGMNFCIETGPDKISDLKNFLDEIDSKGSGVNFDSANILMVQNEEPSEGVYLLKDYVKFVHAKDGRFIKPSNSEAVYIPDILGIPHQEYGHYAQEPLGKGQVDFKKFLKALKDVDFDGTIILEREGGNTVEKDMLDGIAIIENILKQI